MPILITADLHLSDNKRDQYRFFFLQEEFPALIEKHRIDEVYILGDLTEAKDNHSAPLVNAVVDGVSKIHSLAPVTLLRGNHDGLRADSPFFRFLHNIPELRYISRPRRVGNIYFLPHTRNPQKDWNKLDFKDIELILTHNTFAGAAGGFGHRLEGISLDLLPDVPIISGDVHVPQRFENLTYVGSPHTIDFGDDFQPRVLLLEGTIAYQSEDLSGPQKRLIHAKLDKDGLYVVAKECEPDDVVRVEVSLHRTDYALWSEITKEVRAWAAKKEVLLDSVLPKISDQVRKTQKLRTVTAVSDEQILDDYGRNKRIDKATMKVGKELL